MAVVVLIFVATNVTSAVLINHQQQYHHSLPLYILVIRVSINGALFLLAAIVLSVCIYKMRTMSSSNVILEAKVNFSVLSATTRTMCVKRNIYSLIMSDILFALEGFINNRERKYL